MKNLRIYRLELGLSQIELALSTGIPRYRIQLAERGVIELSEIEVSIISRMTNRLLEQKEVTHGNEQHQI